MAALERLDSFSSAEEKWQKLLPLCTVDTLFITAQWQRVWWEQFSDGAETMILCLKGEDGIDAIAPLARRNGSISLIGNQEVCDYNDFLVSRGAESRFYSSLLEHLDKEAWEVLELFSLPENSPTLHYLPDLAREHGYSVEVREEDVVPGVALPNDWDTFLQLLSKKDRHELRRKLRRLESAGDDFRWYHQSSFSDVEGSLDDFFNLMRYSKDDKRRFLTPSIEQFFRSIAKETTDMGIFKLFFLEMKGERVASAICFDYGQSRLLYNSGFNPDYGYYSVGLLLKALCIKDAIERGMTYFDFLRGPEPYKYDLGGQNRNLYQMVVRRS